MRYNNDLKKCDIITLIILGSVLVLSTIIIAVMGAPKKVLPENEFKNIAPVVDTGTDNNGNGAKQGDEETNVLDGPILAPFIDMVSWVDPSNEYSINGVPNLEYIHSQIGANVYNLGFIRIDDKEPFDKDGNLRWCWGGYFKLSEDGNDGYQYEGIKKSIQGVRDNGGEIIVSVGGQLGNAPWVVSNDVDKLKEMYLDVIDTYNLKRIDLDIEETNQGFSQNVANAKAIKKVQDRTGVEVVLTIPIMPYGYTSTQKNLLRAYIGNGVNIKLINNMTMCYGSEVNPGEDFGEASVRALQNANVQIRDIYREYGVDYSEQEVYKMLGATVDIGYENEYNPIFTTAMTQMVAEFAKNKEMGMFSYWSLNRDAKFQPNKGVTNLYEFYEASKAFLN